MEFVADKMPGVDTGWDSIHTFILIPLGAVPAAGAVGDVSPAMSLAATIAGGGIAAGTHAIKAGSRVLINTTPEPCSGWVKMYTSKRVMLPVAAVAGGSHIHWG